MKYIKVWESFVYAINENTSAAKQYVTNRAAKRLEKEPGELSEEERRTALETPAIREIFELTKDHPNYSLSFLRFYFEQRARIKRQVNQGGEPDTRSLEYLMDIIRNKKQILSQLEHNFDYYASLKTENGLTGFEKLTDAIRTVERAKESKWFVDRLPRALRDQYRALPKDAQARVINLAVQLKELGETSINRLFDKIKAFTSWKIEDVIEYASNYVKGYANLGVRKKIKEIEDLEPEAGILYMDDQYLALSVRTENSQKKICAIANWCLNRDSFESYVSNAVQVNIFNFGSDPSDPLFLTGTTINYHGKVTASHDINDKDLKQTMDPAEHFQNLDYPQSLIDSIVKTFPTEVEIKKVVYELQFDELSPEVVFKTILRATYLFEFEMNEAARDAIFKIIDSRVKSKLTKDQIIQLYMQYGVLSKLSAQLLKFMLNDASKDELRPIFSATVEAFKKIHNVAKLFKGRDIVRMENVLAQEKEVFSELGISEQK
jgi:hypothetical protein